ncbi:MAG: acyl-ACP--UDP-N-acetylglucosamine O-acyltransferase [Spirochaetes bacterium]|nr:acyl-ACP--UDP-N-acetylglucosamine O-acyltransferase [Spirochaetota bacterium]
MKDTISLKAHVHKKAVIGKGVTIDPFTVIEANVKIGDGTTIGPNVHITGYTDIGKNCQVHAGAVIGDFPQDYNFKNKKSFTRIGDNNIIRECVTIHRGTEEDSKTIVGNNNMFMAYSHVGHNCQVGDNIVMVNLVSLGGYVVVEKNVFISAVVQVHQFCRIGKFAMIAPLSKVGKDIPPFLLAEGSTVAKVRGLNVVGLRRGGFSSQDREMIKKAYKTVYHSNLNVTQAMDYIKNDHELMNNSFIKEFVEFILAAKRGIAGHI